MVYVSTLAKVYDPPLVFTDIILCTFFSSHPLRNRLRSLRENLSRRGHKVVRQEREENTLPTQVANRSITYFFVFLVKVITISSPDDLPQHKSVEKVIYLA